MALVQLELLNQIELATGKKITEHFDWIVASGIGGLLVLLMVYGTCDFFFIIFNFSSATAIHVAIMIINDR